MRFRKFSAQEHDLRRVVDPDEDNDDGRRRTKSGFQTLFADVKSDGELTEFEQQCRESGAELYFSPFDSCVR